MFDRYSRTALALMAAPLYAGPVLAGWSAAPTLTILAFASLFFLMQMTLGRATADGVAAQVSALAFLALVQLVLVTIVFAAGMGIALITGTLPLPLWLPLGLSAIGAVVGVLRYRSTSDDAAMLDVLDHAITSIEIGLPVTGDKVLQDEWDQEALTALLALPDTTTVSTIDEIVQRLEQLSGTNAYPGLLAEIDEGNRNVDLAMLRYLASANIRGELLPLNDLGFALELILNSDEPAVLSELIMLIETLLSEGAPARSLPATEILSQKAKQFPDLQSLVTRVHQRHASKATEMSAPIILPEKEQP